MATDFVALTEVAGDEVSAEQVERLARRYYWAADYCDGKDVLEAACGTAQGVGYLAGRVRSLRAGDYSAEILARARRHYAGRFTFERFDAERLPFRERSFDVVILFEALYYLPDPLAFFTEARRVLRPGGVLLVATANKDLFDFTPSPHSHQYFGVTELTDVLSRLGFRAVCFGDTPIDETSLRQRALRPVKALVSTLGLMPKSMRGKKLLKRFVFGGLIPMPAEISEDTAPRRDPAILATGKPDRRHKVILCAAELVGGRP